MPGEPDNQLVYAAVNGDADALSALLAAFGPQVRRRLNIGQVWQGSLDAADVMQVTYLEAFLSIRQLTLCTPEGFLAWLTRMADNNLRDAIRELERGKRGDPRRRVVATSPDESFRALLESVGASTATGSRQMAANESRSLLDAAMQRLPESYRQVITFFDLEGQSVQEVADKLGRSPGAVYMLRTRALGHLRDLLGSPSIFF